MIEIDLTAPNGRCEDCGEPKEVARFAKCDDCFEEWREERYQQAIEDNYWEGGEYWYGR